MSTDGGDEMTERKNHNKLNNMRKFLAAVCALALLAAAVNLPLNTAYALAKGDSKKSEDSAAKQAAEEEKEPIREVHKVNVAGKQYCFFVTHNVVLTPEEIQGMTDEELTTAILDRSGLYMKEMNCKTPSHKAITAKAWVKSGGSFLLSKDDMSSVRNAAPEDGEPVKLYMDLKVSTEPLKVKKSDTKSADAKEETKAGTEEGTESDAADGETTGEEGGAKNEGEDASEEEQEPVTYTTYKKVSPKLLFMAVATPADAKLGEDICEEVKVPDNSKPQKEPSMPSGGGEAEEMLPEYRSISMVDRSGPPLKATLEDGTSVSLRWIDPKDKSDEQSGSFIDRIPGGYISLGAVILAAAGAIFAVIRRKRSSEEE